MAQMVARRIGNAEVTGSIPVASFFSILHYINIIADMAELADAPDLGSGVHDVQVRFLLSAEDTRTVGIRLSGRSESLISI